MMRRMLSRIYFELVMGSSIGYVWHLQVVGASVNCHGHDKAACTRNKGGASTMMQSEIKKSMCIKCVIMCRRLPLHSAQCIYFPRLGLLSWSFAHNCTTAVTELGNRLQARGGTSANCCGRSDQK